MLLLRRFIHTSRPLLNTITSVCPGQGNISESSFRLIQYEVDTAHNARIIELLKHAQSIVPEIPISEYFSSKTYPAGDEIKMQLRRTSIVQPLVLLSTYLNYEIIKAKHGWDVLRSDYLLGHSLGELSALVLQDGVSLESGLRGAYLRGKLMENAFDDGKKWSMVALLFRSRDFESICKVCGHDIGLNIANINGYEQIVVSGEREELVEKLATLDKIQKELVSLKQWKSRIRKVWLQTEIAAHHPKLDCIKEELREIIKVNDPELKVPIVCNLNGLVVEKNTERVIDNFIEVTSKPVQFTKCMETIAGASKGKHSLLNVSDVTYGLTNKFSESRDDCVSYNLLNEIETAL